MSGGSGPGGFSWNWSLAATDDAGTEYNDYNGGAFDSRSGQAAAHGTRDIGGQIPPAASSLTLRLRPVRLGAARSTSTCGIAVWPHERHPFLAAAPLLPAEPHAPTHCRRMPILAQR
jgi:hypothetical protein